MDFYKLVEKLNQISDADTVMDSHHMDQHVDFTEKPDHEVSMSRSDVWNIAQNGLNLYEMLKKIPEEQGMPGWISEKITLANDYMEAVVQYYQEQAQHQEVTHGEDLFAETASAGASAVGGVATGGDTGFAQGIGEVRRMVKPHTRRKHRR